MPLIVLEISTALRSASDPTGSLLESRGERVEVDDSSTLGQLCAQLLLNSANVLEQQDLFVVSKGFTVFEPCDTELKLADAGIETRMKLFVSASSMTFDFTHPEHNVLVLPGGYSGNKLFVHPPCMGYRFLEQIHAWLSCPKVQTYLDWKYEPKSDKGGVQKTIATRLAKLARGFAVFGGGDGSLVANFTLEFESDLESLRRKLDATATQADAGALDIPHDFDSSKLRLPATFAMAHAEAALVQQLYLVGHEFSLAGTPLLITSEPSGPTSMGALVRDQLSVHGSLSFILAPKALSGIDHDPLYISLTAFCAKLGLVPKQCGSEATSLPGLKINLNYPLVTVLLWQYELKTPFGRETCCIVKELFGQGNRMGFMCMVRKWKAGLGIPCAKYPTIAMLKLGAWSEHIADRPLPQGLVDFKHQSKEELKAVGRACNEPIAAYAIAETQTETQPSTTEMLQPLKQVATAASTSATARVQQRGGLYALLACLSEAGCPLGAQQQEACNSLLAEVSAMGEDDFDAEPQEGKTEEELELDAAGSDPEKLKELATKLVGLKRAYDLSLG